MKRLTLIAILLTLIAGALPTGVAAQAQLERRVIALERLVRQIDQENRSLRRTVSSLSASGSASAAGARVWRGVTTLDSALVAATSVTSIGVDAAGANARTLARHGQTLYLHNLKQGASQPLVPVVLAADYAEDDTVLTIVSQDFAETVLDSSEVLLGQFDMQRRPYGFDSLVVAYDTLRANAQFFADSLATFADSVSFADTVVVAGPLYAEGAITSTGSLVTVDVPLTTPGPLTVTSTGQALEGVQLLSGSASSYTAYTIGRTAAEGYLGVADAAGIWSGAAVAGDVVFRASNGNAIVGSRTASGRVIFTTGSPDTEKAAIESNGDLALKQDLALVDDKEVRLGNGTDGLLKYDSGSDEVNFDFAGSTKFVVRTSGGTDRAIFDPNTGSGTIDFSGSASMKGAGATTTPGTNDTVLNDLIVEDEASLDRLVFRERTSDPDDPPEGESVFWQSDGTDSGDDGDIMFKITAGSVTKTGTLIDYSTF